METVYLDNSATTKVCDTAKQNFLYAIENCWGNPSALYKAGMDSERLIEKARAQISAKLHCREEEIFFTGCGTESNNTALFTAAEARKKRGKRIVTSAVEHPSVSKVCDELEARGFEIIRLPVGSDGRVSVKDIEAAVNEDTILVSLMAVNNETGAIMPIEAVKPAIEKAGNTAIFHCDAVQAFGKLPIDVKKLGIDLLSASGHKLHAPKGIGFLYKSKDIHLKPYLFGGGQEKGQRSGTQSVELIHALSGAVSELPPENIQIEKMKSLNLFARKKLSEIGGITFNSPENALPYILNFSVEGIRSETMLHFLEADGIYVSSGSACSKGKPSSVLKAMGISSDRADSAIRVSMSRYTTEEDIVNLALGIEKASKRLMRKSRR